MLLDLAGLGACATGLREIRGHCVYNVLVRHGGTPEARAPAMPYHQCTSVHPTPLFSASEELDERQVVNVIVLEGVERFVEHGGGPPWGYRPA